MAEEPSQGILIRNIPEYPPIWEVVADQQMIEPSGVVFRHISSGFRMTAAGLALLNHTDGQRKGAKAALKQVQALQPDHREWIFEDGRVYSRRQPR